MPINVAAAAASAASAASAAAAASPSPPVPSAAAPFGQSAGTSASGPGSAVQHLILTAMPLQPPAPPQRIEQGRVMDRVDKVSLRWRRFHFCHAAKHASFTD
jgi:hypothetical protein